MTRRTILARPAVMAAVLVYLAGATTAMIEGLTLNAPVSVVPSAEREVWSVSWADLHDGDITTVADRAEDMGAETLAVVALPPPDPEDAARGLVAEGEVNVADCGAAMQFFGLGAPTMECTRETALAAGLPYALTFGPGAGSADGGAGEVSGMLVSAPPDWTEADAMALFSGFPVVNAWKLAGTSDFFSPVYDWLAGAMIAATGLLAIGLVREVGDRIMVVVSERSRLLRAGLREQEADWVYGLATMLPMGVALPLGYLAARVFAANGVGYVVTADSIDVIAVVALVVAGLTAAVIALTLWWQKRIEAQRG